MIQDNFAKGDRHPGHEFYNAVARAANLAIDLKQSVHNAVEISNDVLTGQVVIDVVAGNAVTGQALPRLSVLEIDDPLWRTGNDNEIKNNVLNRGIAYRGEIPTGENGKTAVITLTNLRPGEINKAVIMWIVPCVVDVLDTAHRFARPIAENTTMLESSDSGNIRLVLEPTRTGVQVVDVMLGFGGGGTATAAPPVPSPDTITVPVFYPARQWTHKMSIDGEENKRLWSESRDPYDSYGSWFMNACGLTHEGKTPLPVMELETK